MQNEQIIQGPTARDRGGRAMIVHHPDPLSVLDLAAVARVLMRHAERKRQAQQRAALSKPRPLTTDGVDSDHPETESEESQEQPGD